MSVDNSKPAQNAPETPDMQNSFCKPDYGRVRTKVVNAA